MQTQNGIKRIKLIVLICVLALAGVGLCGQPKLTHAAQEQPRRALEFVPINAPLDARAGVDDGAMLAVHFFGSTRGTLETCG